MQDSLVVQSYPRKFVPSSVMNYASSIYDIFDRIEWQFSDNTIVLQYINNWILVNLWHCSLHMYWEQSVVSNFYTSNLSGIDESFKLRTSASEDIHILQSSIKYIWKEIFGKVLDICRKNNVSSIKLSPLASTNSLFFYRKMIDYYPDDIKTIFSDWERDMIFLLK